MPRYGLLQQERMVPYPMRSKKRRVPQGKACRDMTISNQFEALLEESVKIHGHLCAGQVLGVRMSMLGLRAIGISDPKGADRKKLIVFVEMDRCATDAVQSVTGCSLGRRSMKFMDFGKMAATFLNVKTNKAVRVAAREESRDAAKNHMPSLVDKYKAQIEAYKIMSENELFEIQTVTVILRPEGLPGRPLRRIQCQSCSEHVQDMREIIVDGKVLCRQCAGEGYYIRTDEALHGDRYAKKS
jgi:formylmethanofuran dehydrogenase subunit E